MRFAVIFLFLLASMTYVGWRVWWLVPVPVCVKWSLVAVIAVCLALEIVSFTPLMNRMPLDLASFVYNVGNKSLIILMYLLMAFLLIDIMRFVHILPHTVLTDNWITTATLAVVMSAVFVYGSVHYQNKKRVELVLDSGGRLKQPVTAVMASDLHIGYCNRRADLAKWVDLINAEHPDLVLVAGDIVDFGFRPVIEEDMAAEFRRIEAPVYACLGNHEYYSGESDAEHFYRESGINLLIDSSIMVDGVRIIGRDDRTNRRRKSLSELVADDSLYTIVLDHQPCRLEDAERQGVDFQLSGHTHRGQVWPLSWVTDVLYECSWGSHQRGATHYYVSSGLGIWGGKYRIGTQSEYVVAQIR